MAHFLAGIRVPGVSYVSVSYMSLNSLRLPRQLSRSTHELHGSRGISTTYWRQHHIRGNLDCVSFSIAMIIHQSHAIRQFLFRVGEREDLSTTQASALGRVNGF